MTIRNLDALFRASSLLILGEARSLAQHQLMSNLEGSVPPSRRTHVAIKSSAVDWPSAEVAILLQTGWMDAGGIDALGRRGCKALIWAADSPPGLDVLQAAKPYVMRVLGPRTAGLIHTGNLLNLSTLTLMPKPGSVALIAQSQSIAAAAVDWAAGRGIGFSWLAVTGAEADVDIADLLDHAAFDPRTRSVIIQIGNIGHARKFMSAARAAARVKPVLVLQTRNPTRPDAGSDDPVRSAAFRRAGLVECETLGGLFDGLAALELLPSVSGDRIAVVGNGTGVCTLAADAVLRQGLQPAELSAVTRQGIAARIPQSRFVGSTVDFGDAPTSHVLAALRALAGDAGVSATLLIHSPMAGQPHEALGKAIADAGLGERLLTVWLGLASAQPARQASSTAHIATFASADQAVRAVRYRSQHRHSRELLGQTPPPDASPDMDRMGVAQSLEGFQAHRSLLLSGDEALPILARYALAPSANATGEMVKVRIGAALHAELGMNFSVQGEPGSVRHPREYGFAPFDELLARRMLVGAGWIGDGTPPAIAQAASAALIRLGQLVIDQPLIRRLDAVLAWTADGKLVAIPECVIDIADDGLPERQRIALAPYPAALKHEVMLRAGRRYTVSAVRPADEPAVLRLLARLNPEEIRLRYFAFIRHFTHDMAARMTQVDYDREFTLAASAATEPGEIAALATLVADPDGAEAEYAVLVHHDHVRQGLGRHLLERLLRIAKTRGIGMVHGDVLADNAPMLGLVRSLGFKVTESLGDQGCRRVEISARSESVLAGA